MRKKNNSIYESLSVKPTHIVLSRSYKLQSYLSLFP